MPLRVAVCAAPRSRCLRAPWQFQSNHLDQAAITRQRNKNIIWLDVILTAMFGVTCEAAL